MQSSLILTTFFMGLAGGPHCVAMCGAACGSLNLNNGQSGTMQFFAGRIIGYSLLGAFAAASVGVLAWVSSQTNILHPLWTFFHVLVLSWGLILLLYARQPVWVDRFGRNIWQRLKQLAQARGGALFTGVLWALMPCGLLYSAALVASLSGSPIQGAISMTGFALGSSVSLLLAPWLWLKLKRSRFVISEPNGMRMAGLMLIIASGWAIWMDLAHQTKVFCVV